MYWIREIAGWLLVALGLFVLYVCFVLLVTHHAILEAIFLTVIGVIVFRGGLHLIKVAVAGRVCREAQQMAREPAPRPREHVTHGAAQKNRIRNLGRI